MNDSNVRCGVIGVGRMGRHHARVYATRTGVDFVGVVDTNPETGQAIVEEWGGTVYDSVEAMMNAGVDAVTIATPTIHHRSAAETLLRERVACLIEKPLAPNAEEAKVIADAADAGGSVLQVGHIVRYDPVMQAIGAIENLNPRFIQMDRVSPMTFRSVDVGVVLDMMIHDLDLLLMLTGREPSDIRASAVCVLGEAEDVCNARLEFAPGCAPGCDDEANPQLGCVANLTASRLALKTERKIRIICEDAYVSADFVARKVQLVRKTANDEQLAELRERLKVGEDLTNLNYLELVEVEDMVIGDGDALELQIEDFLSAVREGRRPTIDAQAGFAAVRTAERIVEEAKRMGSKMV